jgi:hypothetical protein
MARNGLKSSMLTLMSGRCRSTDAVHDGAGAAKVGAVEKYQARNQDGAVTYLMGERSYKRRLGLAGDAAPESKEYMSGYKRHQHGKPNPLCERMTRRCASRIWTSKASM